MDSRTLRRLSVLIAEAAVSDGRQINESEALFFGFRRPIPLGADAAIKVCTQPTDCRIYMRAFLSHSSVDKDVVIAVRDGLEKDSTWLDRAEVEWGDLFLEKIADGIKLATDFVLFWSAAAKKSEWVRLEINMAFIQALREKAIRLRVVLLDQTPLPLQLQPFQVLSVIDSPSPAAKILEGLLPILREPVRSARSRFVNRHDEIARIEAAVDDPAFHTVWAFGFTGVGKVSVIEESLKRIFEGASVIRIDANQGTGLVELALALSASIRNQSLPINLDKVQLEDEIRLSLDTLAKAGQLLLISNIQHWLDEEGKPQGPLPYLLAAAREIAAFRKRPLFLTSTRYPSLDGSEVDGLAIIKVAGLSDEHTATIVRNWYFAIYGNELEVTDAKRIAPKLYGHPVAARLVAGLLGNRGVNFLEDYPQEIISLRRDLARILLQGISLSPSSEKLMETLALAGVGLPASLIVSTGFSEDDFQQAVTQCANAGLVTADSVIETHPLFQDFFWHRMHRSGYRELALKLADVLKTHLSQVDKTSPEFASLLPVAFRSYALAGDIGKADALRSDLSGELEAAAIILYNRRDYSLADEYIEHLLQHDPGNWRMRLYRARIRIRQEEWAKADAILDQMLRERAGDVGVLHAKGWSQLRQRHLPQALEIFSGIIARREHVASLRDAAECLHRLDKNKEALKFLTRAKQRESENPFVLDLESRILEDLNQLDAAYESALLASARDPLNANMQNRLGMIRIKLGHPEQAVDHFCRAIELDQAWFSPVNSLASVYLDINDVRAAEKLLAEHRAKAHTPTEAALLRHTEARIALYNRDFERSQAILKQEIAAGRNVIPNLGLLVRVDCAIFDHNIHEYPTIASLNLKAAEAELKKLEDLDRSNEFITSLRSQIEDRFALSKLSSSGKRIVPVATSAPPLAVKEPTPIPQNKNPIKPPLVPPSKPPSKH